MNARQRGATWLLAAVLAGRILDVFDLPFERRFPPQVPDSTTTSAGPDSVPPAPRPRPQPSSPIAINHADERQLQALPGVGPVLAKRIVAYRQEHGPLSSAAHLQRIPGIGPRLSARLAPLVRFD